MSPYSLEKRSPSTIRETSNRVTKRPRMCISNENDHKSATTEARSKQMEESKGTIRRLDPSSGGKAERTADNNSATACTAPVPATNACSQANDLSKTVSNEIDTFVSHANTFSVYQRPNKTNSENDELVPANRPAVALEDNGTNRLQLNERYRQGTDTGENHEQAQANRKQEVHAPLLEHLAAMAEAEQKSIEAELGPNLDRRPSSLSSGDTEIPHSGSSVKSANVESAYHMETVGSAAEGKESEHDEGQQSEEIPVEPQHSNLAHAGSIERELGNHYTSEGGRPMVRRNSNSNGRLASLVTPSSHISSNSLLSSGAESSDKGSSNSLPHVKQVEDVQPPSIKEKEENTSQENVQNEHGSTGDVIDEVRKQHLHEREQQESKSDSKDSTSVQDHGEVVPDQGQPQTPQPPGRPSPWYSPYHHPHIPHHPYPPYHHPYHYHPPPPTSHHYHMRPVHTPHHRQLQSHHYPYAYQQQAPVYARPIPRTRSPTSPSKAVAELSSPKKHEVETNRSAEESTGAQNVPAALKDIAKEGTETLQKSQAKETEDSAITLSELKRDGDIYSPVVPQKKTLPPKKRRVQEALSTLAGGGINPDIEKTDPETSTNEANDESPQARKKQKIDSSSSGFDAPAADMTSEDSKAAKIGTPDLKHRASSSHQGYPYYYPPHPHHHHPPPPAYHHGYYPPRPYAHPHPAHGYHYQHGPPMSYQDGHPYKHDRSPRFTASKADPSLSASITATAAIPNRVKSTSPFKVVKPTNSTSSSEVALPSAAAKKLKPMKENDSSPTSIAINSSENGTTKSVAALISTLSASETQQKVKCVHIYGSMLLNFIGSEGSSSNTKSVRSSTVAVAAAENAPTLPPFHELVNYPGYLPRNSPEKKKRGRKGEGGPTDNNADKDSPVAPNASCNNRNCVMCGTSCFFGGSLPGGNDMVDGALSPLPTQPSASSKCDDAKVPSLTSSGTNSTSTTTTQQHFTIPRQNKGLCTSCDVKVWLYMPAFGDEIKDNDLHPSGTIATKASITIKWCKGCKNFRTWPQAFGAKSRATKCAKCRERQRYKYACTKKKEREEMEGR